MATTKEDNVDYQHSHLWLLTLADKKVTQLTSGDHFHVRDFVWNPDSQRLAVNAMPAPDMGTLMETQIYLLDVRTFTCDPITPRRTFSPCWSPDGTQLVYERGEANSLEGAFYKNSYLEIISLHDGSTTRVDTAFDENMNPLKWVDDGIYFYAFQRTSIRLFLVTENDWTIRSIVPDEMDDFVAMRYSFTADGSFCAVIYATTDHSTEVGIIETTSGTITTLTDYDAPTREWQLAKHEIYTWESSDGTPIEGILTKPHDFDPSQKYPLLVITHGGPTWISLTARLFGYERRLYPIQQWVAQGAVVLQPNYRGSAGYGEAFRSLNVRELGIGDYADVISGVDALVAEGFIDETRMGKMGWSQGGYISAFTTTYSDRFAAVSVGAGISNWMTYYVNTDIHPFTINYLKATPW
ncbi:MAG: prolyl oligopeptidase family serine peptidase, partial [Chloroflexota bacterium]